MRRVLHEAVAAMLGLLLVACQPRARTEVILIVDAEARVRDAASHVDLTILAAPRSRDEWVQVLDQTIAVGESAPAEWPLILGLVPDGGDASRRYDVRARARREEEVLAETRAISGYLAGKTLMLRLRLEDACVGVPCDPDLTCRAGHCVDPWVDPEDLRDRSDAGAPDGGSGIDGGLHDAGEPDGGAGLDAAQLEDGGLDGSAPDPIEAQEAYIKASNTGAEAGFGMSVSMSADGRVLAVGAGRESGVEDWSGAVYVFRRSDDAWAQEAYLKASQAGYYEQLGTYVALSADGSVLAAGAWAENSAATGVGGDQTNGGATASGAVYVFRREGGAWSEEAYIKASNAGESDHFGWSVAVSADGSVLAVGADGENSAATGVGGDQTSEEATDSGAVYVFRHEDGAWFQDAYVKASNTSQWGWFGYSVALSGDGDVLAVGASGDDSAATGIGGDQQSTAATRSGAAYVFRRDGDVWAQEAYVKASNTEADDWFGRTVALSGNGNVLAVAAPEEDGGSTGVGGDDASNTAEGSGAVYVFRHGAGGWTQEAYVKASNTGVDDAFGGYGSVALSEDASVLAIGAFLEDSAATGVGGGEADNGAADSGAVYVFRHDARGWVQEAYVKASNTGVDDYFGRSVALSGDASSLAVGAWREDSATTGVNGDQASNASEGSGAAYVFR